MHDFDLLLKLCQLISLAFLRILLISWLNTVDCPLLEVYYDTMLHMMYCVLMNILLKNIVG